MVTPAGGKLWRLNYRFAGKQKTLSLGYNQVSSRNNFADGLGSVVTGK